MSRKITLALSVLVSLLSVRILAAQVFGPQIQQFKDGIYVYVGKDRFPNNIEAAYRAVAGK